MSEKTDASATDEDDADTAAFSPRLRHIDGAALFGGANELFIRQPKKGWYVLRRYGDGTLTLQKRNVSPRKRVRNSFVR